MNLSQGVGFSRLTCKPPAYSRSVIDIHQQIAGQYNRLLELTANRKGILLALSHSTIGRKLTSALGVFYDRHEITSMYANRLHGCLDAISTMYLAIDYHRFSF